MINPKNFRADWLSKTEIGQKIVVLRKQFKVLQRIPIEVLVFAEHDLKLEFEFASIKAIDQEALLRPDFTGIVFDNSAFDANNYHRLRFSVAHELGHYYLHKNIYGKLDFKNPAQWLNFVDEIPRDQYNRIEWQADEFAGQLLIPKEALSPALDETMRDAKEEGYFHLGASAVLDFCCRAMHGDFGVSRQAMETRLHSAELWPHPDLPPAEEASEH